MHKTKCLQKSIALLQILFGAIWFLQVGADWNAWYSGQEHGADLKRNPFKDFRSNPGAAVAIGKMVYSWTWSSY